MPMTTKALEPDGERRFLLRLNHAHILMIHALRFQTQPGTREAASKGRNGWRVDTSGGHSPASSDHSDCDDTIETRKGKEP